MTKELNTQGQLTTMVTLLVKNVVAKKYKLHTILMDEIVMGMVDIVPSAVTRYRLCISVTVGCGTIAKERSKSMSRYIDADKAIEVWKDQDYIKLSSQETKARIMLDAVPSADAVEVVRCKECRYEKTCCRNIIDDPVGVPVSIDYCSYGERKEDDDGQGNGKKIK